MWEVKHADVEAENVTFFSCDDSGEIIIDDREQVEQYVYALGIVFEDDNDFGDIKYFENKLDEENQSIDKPRN